jgi:hypothetical protein
VDTFSVISSCSEEKEEINFVSFEKSLSPWMVRRRVLQEKKSDASALVDADWPV